MVTGL
ncbi:hypothetical protein CgunFtcFv8_003031 [Champsocephalus gunnari]